MMPSSLIHQRTETRHSRRLSTGGAPTCVDTPKWPETASLIASRNTPALVHARARAQPLNQSDRSDHRG
jgi:hypothetical protein